MMKKITLIAAIFAVFTMNAQDILFEDDFDNETVDATTFTNWDSRDLDGDGQFWEVADIVGSPAEASIIEGLTADSDSWEGTAFNPDNLLVINDAISLPSDSSAQLEFVIGTYQNNGTFLGDRLQVYITTSDATDDILATTPVYDMTVGDEVAADDGGANSATTITIDLSSQAGEDVYISFRHFDTFDENSVLVDQVSVSSETLSVNDENIAGFTQFVDVNANLNLRANVALENVELFNIVGQQVVNRTLSSNNETVNLSNLNAGVYIARVSVAGQTETFKIVKR